MPHQDEMSIGEIGRSLTRLELSQKVQTEKLDEITEQTTRTNGNLIRHDEWLKRHDSEIRDLKRGQPDGGSHNLRRAADKKDALTFTISRATIITAAIALGSFVAALVAALMGWKLPL